MAYRRIIPALALLFAALLGSAVAQNRQESGRLEETRRSNAGELKPKLPTPPADLDAARLQIEADTDRVPAESASTTPKPKTTRTNSGPFSR